MKKKLYYKPRKLQKEFHAKRKRWSVLVTHRRFGKTVMALQELIAEAMSGKKEFARYAYLAPTRGMVKGIAWDYLKRFTERFEGMKFNNTELRADFKNGARIQLLSSWEPDRIRGVYLDGAVLDEYALMSPELFPKVIRPALSDRKGFAVFLGTPLGQNHFYEVFKTAQEKRGWFAGFYPASKTGLISAAELEDAREMMSEEEFAQEYECSFTAALRGAYYGKLVREAEQEARVRRGVYDPKLKVSTFWDLGFKDDTAIVFAQVSGSEVRVIDAYANRGEALPYYFEVLRKKGYKYEEHFAPHDAGNKSLTSGKSCFDVARECGFEFRMSARAKVQDGINAARVLLKRCVFEEEKTKELREALSQYRQDYDEKRKVFSSRPLHDWTSHYADAFRYLAVNINEKKEDEGDYLEALDEYLRSG